METQPLPGLANQAPSDDSAPLAQLIGGMVFLQLLASICYPIAKYGLGIIEPFTFAFYRYIISSVVLLTMTKLRKQGRPVERPDWWRLALLGLLIIPGNQALFLLGQSMTGAGHGAFLFATTPIWVFVLAIVHLKERPRWRRTVGIVFATVGVMIILYSGLADVGTHYLMGDLILIGSVAAWGYYTVLGKPLVKKYGALRTTAYALGLGSAMYMPFGTYFAITYDYSQSNIWAWGSVVYMAIALSAVVYVIWYWLLKYLDASRIAVYHNVQPIIASAVAYFFLGEALSAGFVLGGLVVISGVLITEL